MSERFSLTAASERWKLAQRIRTAHRDLRRMEDDLEVYRSTEGLRTLLRLHVAYLDHLTLESHGFTDHRLDFATFYLTHRPKGGRTK